jgi:cobalamin synthase
MRELAFELALAVATLTLWRVLDERCQGSAEQRAHAMLFIPLVGLILGLALAVVDHSLAVVAALRSRSAIVIALSILAGKAIHQVGLAHTVGCIRAGTRPSWTGLTEVGPMGALAAIALVALEVYLLASITHPPGRARAIVLATMLSRWAIVPIGYGLKPLERWGLGVPWEGGIRFREFAGSSLIALGLAMGLYEVVAIAAIIVLAAMILLLRLLFSRRLGGADGFALAAGAAVCELAMFALLAAIRF